MIERLFEPHPYWPAILVVGVVWLINGLVTRR
jgi:hypothetical protein